MSTNQQAANQTANTGVSDSNLTAAEEEKIKAAQGGPGWNPDATTANGAALGNPNISAQGRRGRANRNMLNVAPSQTKKGDVPFMGGQPGYDEAGNKMVAGTDYVEKVKEESDKKIVEVTRNTVQDKARDNPLFNYADYTYGLSLHVVPPVQYNKIVSDPNYVYVPVDENGNGTVLIASAGRRNDTTFQRHAKFNEDFFFETLKMTTVVGASSRSRNTNVVELSFTIIEPYGVTLLNRFLKMADSIKASSWMQIPFLLQIDFFGNTDLGDILHPIPDQTKYIPIKFLACKIKVTGKGAEYQVSATPFSHSAYTETVASTPAFLEVKAKSLADFFSSSGSAGEADKILAVGNAARERIESTNRNIATLNKATPNGKRADELEKENNGLSNGIANMKYVVGSYTAALNSFQEQLTKNNHQKISNKYEFVFTDPKMAESLVVIPKKVDLKRTPMSDPTKQAISAIRSRAGLPTAGVDLSKETFSLNAGTSVVDVINQVMRNSKFIRDQIFDPAADGQATADKAKRPIIWWKIVPKLELLDFDMLLNSYSKKITYYISPYLYNNTKFRDAPQSPPAAYYKNYQYLYTGKNQSIIDFSLDFDVMYYTAITADRAKVQSIATQQGAPDKEKNSGDGGTSGVTVMDKVVHPVSGQATMVNSASPDSKGVLVNDFSKSMMSSSRGDMINVKLKIIGDPELIKQDDIFYNPLTNPRQKSEERLVIDTKTNSIIFDYEEVYALLEVRTPTDIDPDTGMADFGSTETSVFSGIYRMLIVENVFERGQFTQTLDLIRTWDQENYDTVNSNKIKDSGENRKKQPETIAETKSPLPFMGGRPGYDEVGNKMVAGIDYVEKVSQRKIAEVARAGGGSGTSGSVDETPLPPVKTNSTVESVNEKIREQRKIRQTSSSMVSNMDMFE